MIWLASTSPRRKVILRRLGVRFRTVIPAYEERNPGCRAPAALVRLHALEKASAVGRSVREGIVIGADTIVWFGGKTIGKPKNLAEARKTLAKLQGQWHVVYTGVALLNIHRRVVRRRHVYVEKTRVLIRSMSDKEIRRYFRRINPLDKAGSYAIQARFSIVERIQGSLFNAMGLPAESLIKNLNIIK
jgi:septum formation protein